MVTRRNDPAGRVARGAGRLLDPHLGVWIVIAIGISVAVWLVVGFAIGPRVHLQGYVTIVDTKSQPCVHIQTEDPPGSVWNAARRAVVPEQCVQTTRR